MPHTHKQLIKKAQSLVKSRQMRHGFTTADCGCALVSKSGNLYYGVSIDTPSSMGFCAEHSAIAAMVTAEEYVIDTIVAVLDDGTVLPPCGRCREFMYQLDTENMNANVIVASDKVVKLTDLLPYPWDNDLL